MAKTRKASKTAWIIAIPSYKRAETLRDKTLKVLEHYHIPTNKIHVFVANKAEYDTYKATLKPGSYGHLHIAELGMAAVRNFITRFFPVGKPIFSMDDDIRGFIEYSEGANRHEQPLRSLSALIDEGFAMARKTGFRFFGTYPIPNGYFMKPKVTTDLRYLPGGAWGIINPGAILTLTLDDKEDYLRTIMMYILDGGVIKFNGVAPLTVGYQGDGGMQEDRTLKRIEASARAMVAAFPDLAKLNLTKKSGKAEVRLRDSRPEDQRPVGPAALKAYTMPIASKSE
jgi:hypothetical protein